jgi:hypothetical protein
MNDRKKFLPSAPYIMYMIARFKKSLFPRIVSMSLYTFVLVLVMHHVCLLSMLVLQGILDLIPLHLFREPLPLTMDTMIPSSKWRSKAFCACARV